MYASMASLIWLLQDSYCGRFVSGKGLGGASSRPPADIFALSTQSRSRGRENGGGEERATTYQGTKIVPDLGDVRVQPDGARVGVERVPILIDLIVEHTNGAPERGVPSIPVYGLLVSFVGLGILLLRHVTSAEEVPALGVVVV